jgi:hypothetical protein
MFFLRPEFLDFILGRLAHAVFLDNAFTRPADATSTRRGSHKGRSPQISFNPFKLAYPSLPTMMWSCTEMPSGDATAMICYIIWMSA